MSDLRTAAPNAAEKVSELQADLAAARQSLSTLDALATRVAEQMDEDWTAFTERVEALLARAGQERAAVGQRTQAAGQALGELDAAVDMTRQATEQGLEGAAAAVSEFADTVEATTTQVDQALDTLDDAGEQLAAQVQSTGETAATGMDEARDFLQNEVFSGLRDLQEVVQREKDAFVQSFNEATAELQESYETWQDRLDDTQRIVEEAFAEAREHLEQVTQFSLEQCAAAYDAELSQIGQLAARLDAAVDQLAEAVRKAQADVPPAGTELQKELDAGATGLQALLNAIGRVEDMLESLRLYTPRG
jgi:ABC-type transporter Mla subunit MlaD